MTFIRSSCSHGTRRASFSTVSISAYYKRISEVHIIHFKLNVKRNNYIKIFKLSFPFKLVWRNKQNHLLFSLVPSILQQPECFVQHVFLCTYMMKDFQSQLSISFIYNKDLVKGYRNKNNFCLDKCTFIAKVD